MKRLPIVVEAAAGGAWAGTLVGLAETLWLWRSMDPDAWMLPWSWGLYGGIGLGLGLAVGLAAAIAAPAVREREGLAAALAAGAAPVAFAGTLLALGTVVGRYVMNRDVFAEQGVPLGTLGGWIGGLALAGLVVVALGAWQGAKVPWVRPVQRWSAAVWAMGLVALLGLAVGMPADEADWTAGEPATATGPSVLFIMVDTMRADHLADPTLPTPALDRLRADGVTFTDAWSHASWTRPGTASLWTSRLPSSHTAATKGSRLPDGVVTWAEALRAGGWRTGALVNNINVTASFGFDQGFDVFVYEAPAYPFGATEGVFGLALYKLVHRVEERLAGGGPPERYYQPADVVLGDARAFLDAQSGPAALFVHLMEPHDPYFVHDEVDGALVARDGFARAVHPDPDPALADDLRARYAGEIAAMDRHLGAFFDGLRRDGLYDDLMIVLTADHGEEFLEHGGWWHGQTLYAEQTQVPLVVKLPGNDLGGVQAPWQVRNLDVPPTLTAALGLPADPSWEGEDLLDDDARRTLRATPMDDPGAEAPTDATDPVADEIPDEAPPVGEGDAVGAPPAAVDLQAACRAARRHALDRLVVMEEDFEGNVVAAVRADGFALHRAAPGGSRALPERALYDVVSDPGEQTDLLTGGPSICGLFPDDHASALGTLLDLARREAAGEAVEGADVEITEAERAQLCALGYLSGDACP